jgi:CBS domain-containing protein
MSTQVKDFMSNSVITAEGEISVAEIRTLMEDKRINAIPILGLTGESINLETALQGIITTTDLSNVVDDNIAIKELIIPGKVHVISRNTSAKSAAKMMLKHKVHHLVVMEDGKIIGMISSLDFVKLVAKHGLD